MMSRTVEHIVNLAVLLEESLQLKLWEYAELLYVQQVAFDDTEPLSANPSDDLAPTIRSADLMVPSGP